MSQIPELLEQLRKKQFLPGARDDVSPESSLSDCFRCCLARAMDTADSYRMMWSVNGGFQGIRFDRGSSFARKMP